ncbi:MAG: hypothetical protein ACE37N_12970 [Pseudohongiellaceae bacterium]
MYSTCPKCGFHNRSADAVNADQCAACGLVFSKWLQNLVSEDPATAATASGRKAAPHLAAGAWQTMARFVLPRRAGVGKLELAGYAVIWGVLLLWGLDFIAMDFRSNAIGQSFLHNINLVFHEAGHVLFRPFGRSMMFLGGSLFQVLLPLLLMLAFLVKNKDGFAASVCLWWAGQSLMDVAPYIADARALRLPLLGGGTGADAPGMHDWANLLRPRGWLQYDMQIASAADSIGSGMLLLALAWGALMLWRYYHGERQDQVGR